MKWLLGFFIVVAVIATMGVLLLVYMAVRPRNKGTRKDSHA